jgi:predicted RNA-binding Zn ribbon-like protein
MIALSFNNTVSWQADGPANDRLETFSDLLTWAGATDLLAPAEIAALQEPATRDPWAAAAALAQTRELRTVLHQILAALARHQEPEPITLRAFSQALRVAAGQLALTWRDGRLAWGHQGEVAPETIVHRIAWAAAQFMTSSELARLGLCANPECGWMFLDSTRNHSRRWCSMQDCGSRAKARRYYRRRKAKAGGESSG